MPFQAQWCVPNQVVYIRQWGTVELEDSVGTDRAIAQFAEESGNQHIHGIIDKLAVESFNFNANDLQKAFRQLSKPTYGWVVAVHDTRFSAFLSQIMANSQEMRTGTFHSLAEAVTFLQTIDEALIEAEWTFDQESATKYR